MSAVTLLGAWAAGWMWVAGLRRPDSESAPARWTLDLALGLAFGLGAGATLFFAFLTVGVGPRAAAILSDLLLLAAGAVVWRRTRTRREQYSERLPAFRWTWLGWIGLAVTAAFLAGSMAKTAASMPHGDWDAWAIWNLRAKFLASEGSWQGAVSPEMAKRTHPEYPLLWSSVVAKSWSWTGKAGDTAAPMAAGALATLGLLGLLLGGLWTLRGAASGAMAALAMMSVVALWQYAAVQYADVPLALFMLGALVAAAVAEGQGWPRGTMALSGALASMALWTKDEGGVFFAAIGATMLAVARRKALSWVLAAVPAALMAAAFKLTLAPASEAWGAPAADVTARLGQILGAFWSELLGLGHFPAHPILIAAVCAVLLGPRRPLQPIWPLIPVAALGVGYIGAFMVTRSELSWHLQTSVTRLWLQILPLLLFAMFMLLRTATSAEPAAQPSRKKR